MSSNYYSLLFFSFLCLNIRLSHSKKETKSSLRVIGGRLAAKDEFPFVVRLDENFSEGGGDQPFENYRRFCTGSALTSSWTLTAAHCVYLEPKFMYVRFNHFLPEIKGEVARVLKIYKNPQFNNQVQFARFDIAMLQTKNVKISRYAKLSALDYTTLIGQQALSLGHGITNNTKGPRPLQVLKGMLSKCTYNRKSGSAIYLGICIQAPCGVVSVLTSGDSGGPVIHSSGIVAVNSMSEAFYNEEKEEWLQLSPKLPSGYVACVSPMSDWIVSHITNNTTYE